MKHDWYLDEYGKIDEFRLENNYHNGPQCRRCKHSYCHHCNPECYEMDCPSGQLDFGMDNVS